MVNPLRAWFLSLLLATLGGCSDGGATLSADSNDDAPSSGGATATPPPRSDGGAGEPASVPSDSGTGGRVTTMPEAGPPTIPAGKKPVTGTPPSPSSDISCYNVRARAGLEGGKFTVPPIPDLYQCFNWSPPWGEKKVQIVSVKPLVDNARILHHMILYSSDVPLPDGGTSVCLGAHPDAAMVAVWTPGAQPLELPPDVGLGLSSQGLVLEVHYNNSVSLAEPDASGVEVCVTEEARPNEAAIHWLGTQLLGVGAEATGLCLPNNTGDVTIISSTPHMHLQGRHMRTVINRAAGGTETVLDTPFDFNNQVTYATPAVVRRGDTLSTTCTFAVPTPFGEGTNQEMCYNFVLAYPAGGLSQIVPLLRKFDCTAL
jgi:Copper type II ascorbate-dependent monooxygenase, N-terminal domain/Copper type II ascorbate-dependent monooxygenase, C-terminal domain